MEPMPIAISISIIRKKDKKGVQTKAGSWDSWQIWRDEDAIRIEERLPAALGWLRIKTKDLARCSPWLRHDTESVHTGGKVVELST